MKLLSFRFWAYILINSLALFLFKRNVVSFKKYISVCFWNILFRGKGDTGGNWIEMMFNCWLKILFVSPKNCISENIFCTCFIHNCRYYANKQKVYGNFMVAYFNNNRFCLLLLKNDTNLIRITMRIINKYIFMQFDLYEKNIFSV